MSSTVLYGQVCNTMFSFFPLSIYLFFYLILIYFIFGRKPSLTEGCCLLFVLMVHDQYFIFHTAGSDPQQPTTADFLNSSRSSLLTLPVSSGVSVVWIQPCFINTPPPRPPTFFHVWLVYICPSLVHLCSPLFHILLLYYNLALVSFVS
ncbi:uncharacterized protein BDV14DRAFT_111291 [Aspergillus stella-maris]|uniref:uncharacterized protein n=1 Tax=Aspergillus stella-maris TaxID=1810926 RepID=UPI003CCCDCE4